MSTRQFDFISGPQTDTLPTQGVIESINRVVKSTSYAMTDIDGYSFVECDTGAITITLPQAANNSDRRIIVYNNSTGSIVVDGYGAELIDAASSKTLSTRYDKLYVQSNGTKWLSISTPLSDAQEVMAFTAIGSVGDTAQLYAGHYPSVSSGAYNDLGTTYAETLAYWKFASGALTTDEKATYTLTNNGTATAVNGILNTAYGTELNGSTQYYTEAGTFMDDISIFTANGIVWEIFLNLDDGAPVSNQVWLNKYNDSNNELDLYHDTSGNIIFRTRVAGTTKDIYIYGALSNNATGWRHVVATHDTSNGSRLYLDSVLRAADPTATTLMSNAGAGVTDFCIGRNQQAAGNYTDGKISYVRVINKKITQKDVDVMYASQITNSLASASIIFDGQIQLGGSTSFVRNYDVGSKIVGMDTSYVYLAGGTIKNVISTDKIKILGR